ncbi:hypothetical protein H6F98_20515 [Microcoleus sp. FACHB-SPT15]|uniref:hypothetical protein n=1 Tax=Microcoleus sp. FACHB-SPT15 TaxID=2692830 RepID=UPI00177B7E76|nr:hypothetical protein [Microcoleus sp. FACHB-SPT15]MBD1807814.1 hypothetical protein [Microcoleus sp. FACHB-SPT15]
MLFKFPLAIQAGIAAGKYVQAISSTGVPLSLARDAATGRFVGHAVGVVGEPFLAVPKLIFGGVQMLQTHRGFQKTYGMLDTGFQQTFDKLGDIQVDLQDFKAGTYSRLGVIDASLQSLQTNLGVLQATTAVIGVGTVAGVALSAVNLHQTLKLRQDIKQLRLEVKDGFIDLKQALKDQGTEILQRIDQVAQDVEFKHHRTILVQAYGRFNQAVNWLRHSLKLPDLNARNAAIAGVQGMLYEALADYTNPEILKQTSVAGRLRRLECAWTIDQTITLTFQLQEAFDVVSDRLASLQNQILKESLAFIDQCESEEELDFLFPELARIHSYDLALLESWQNQTDWIPTLSPDEQKLLESSTIQTADVLDSDQDVAVVTKPEEQSLYENLKQKSHYLSLRDQLKFMVKPDLRRGHESYISQQAPASGLKALAPSNWEGIPDLTVANLYWYFKEAKA